MNFKSFFNVLIRAILTGFAIGIGGTVFLSCESKVLGAFLFGTGLFVILTFGFYLYTGKVGYIVVNKLFYAGQVCLIWVGNFIGTFLMAYLILNTRISGIAEKAAAMCVTKVNDGPLSIFILAFFCGILMFIAADGWKNIENQVARTLAVFLPVVVFILSGFEHCIANMFYFSIAQAWDAHSLLWLLVMTVGNAAGGMFIPFCRIAFVE